MKFRVSEEEIKYETRWKRARNLYLYIYIFRLMMIN